MIQLIDEKREEISALCRQFNLSRLEVFGSAAAGRFDDTYGDVDFMVEFNPTQDLGPWLAHYQDFKGALKSMLGCKVDLVMTGALRNPYVIREVDRTRALVYAA